MTSVDARESHLRRSSIGEALADALMRDNCVCKADLRDLEETRLISAAKASISALGVCILRVEDIAQM